MSNYQGTSTARAGSTRPAQRRLGVGVIAIAAGLATTACTATFDFGTDGSGVAETITFDLADFDQVEVGGVFDVDITVQDGPQSVELTVDDNLVDRIEATVDDGRLRLDISDGSTNFDIGPTVTISVPSLAAIDAGGASDVTIEGLDSDRFELALDGASDLVVDGRAGRLVAEVSGASKLTASGTTDTVTLDVDGAAGADLTQLTAEEVELAVSGAASVELGTVDTVIGEASGASSVAIDEADTVAVSTSGVASVETG
ncbi:MAG: head GIN domain-containing protein [Actinomycetota bacterium]